MKKFWIRTINVCVIVAALIGYSKVTLAHEQTDAAAKAEADRKNAEIAAEAGETGGSYTDGIYQGTATGFGGDITVEVTITDGRIAAVDILSAEKEDSAYLTMANDIIPEILGCTERGCGYHQRCDFQLHRNQKCNGTGSCERRCQINETDG